MEQQWNMEPEELSQKLRRYLITALLVLFVLQMVSMPFAMGYTYAGSSQRAQHLTYRPNKLVWDSSMGIDPVTGAAELDLFDAGKLDGKKYIAPGQSGSSLIQLSNHGIGEIKYTAVLYRIRSSDLLPAEVSMNVPGSKHTDVYQLPEGVDPSDVVQAVTGTVGLYRYQNIEVNWEWVYNLSRERDLLDTQSALAGETVTVGVYVVVEDDNSYSLPETGDSTHIGMYMALMFITGLMLVFLILDRRNEEKWAEIAEEE